MCGGHAIHRMQQRAKGNRLKFDFGIEYSCGDR